MSNNNPFDPLKKSLSIIIETAIQASDDLNIFLDNKSENKLEIIEKFNSYVTKLTKELTHINEKCIPEISSWNPEPEVNSVKVEETEESPLPMLKVVDINKLVDPKKSERFKNGFNNVQTKSNESVIVLTSSDDENESLNKLCKLKDVKVVTISKNQSDSKKVKNNAKEKRKKAKKIVEPCLISDSSEEDTNLRQQLDKNEEKLFKCKVVLPRVPCEKLLEKSDLFKVNRLKKLTNGGPSQVLNHTVQSEIKNNSKQNKIDRKKKSDKITNKEKIIECVNMADKSEEEDTNKEENTNKEEDTNKEKDTNKEEDTDKDEYTDKDEENCMETNNLNPGSELADEQFSNKENESDIDKEDEKRTKRKASCSPKNTSDSDSDNMSTVYRKKIKCKARPLVDEDSDSDDDQKNSDKSNSKGSGSSSSEEEEEEEPKIRKRLKIQKIQSSSEDEEIETRKKIKKLISKDKLSERTKAAEAEERERKQRITEKQKKYNQVYEGKDILNAQVDKLVLDFDEKKNEPLIEVADYLVEKLKPHQASGIQFMWDACFESVKRAKSESGSGCILAHCMGLGKTLQVIVFSHTLLENGDITNVKKVLVVCPLSTVQNWKAEYANWLDGDESFNVFELGIAKNSNAERAYMLRNWHQDGGVMIISYGMFRNLTNENNKRVPKKIRNTFQETLVDPGADLVVCDEGHLLKNEKTSLSISMNRVKTKRRIVLTGTPLQNNLKEFYCMVQFVKPNLLGTYREYMNRFVNPITNGQYTDSTEHDIQIMRKRSHVLHKMLDGIVQRRDYAILTPYLPPKFEYVLFLNLSDVQRRLYEYYKNNLSQKTGARNTGLFCDFQWFQAICTHPKVLKVKKEEAEEREAEAEDSEGSLKEFINDSDSEKSDSASNGSTSGSDSDAPKPNRRITRDYKARNQISDNDMESAAAESKEPRWWDDLCDEAEMDKLESSTKLCLLFEILKECEEIGDKVLVFSQSLYSLNLIEQYLERVSNATQNGEETPYSGSWVTNLDYFRLDGSTAGNLRLNWCDQFNSAKNTRARLFLLSTKAGGLGINLTAANRVIIFDVSWNPSSDTQSIYRVFRFGQTKPSYIYRFVIYGTMEMKIYERQVTKQAISKRVVDEQQIDRHYNQDDLQKLYEYELPDTENRPIPLLPKDVLLAELLQKHVKIIYKYHEHQSLLENKEEETLNEEERKSAWEEYENEKELRSTMSNTIGGFDAQRVFMALTRIVNKDHPNLSASESQQLARHMFQTLRGQIEQGVTAGPIMLKVQEELRKMSVESQMQYREHARLQMFAQNSMLFRQQQELMLKQRLMQQMMHYNMGVPGSSFQPPQTNDVIDLND